VATFKEWARGAVSAYAAAPFAPRRRPPKLFVVLTVGRTGSELLRHLLNSHRGVVCDSELLKYQPFFPRLFIDAAQARAHDGATEAYGWKELGVNVERARGTTPRRFLQGLHDDGYQFILLERRDYLQQSISWYRTSTEGFHFHNGDRAQFSPTHIDPQVLLRAARANEAQAVLVRDMVAGFAHLTLTYEDDLLYEHDRNATLDRICDYLGISRQVMSADMIKITPRETRDMVTNWTEVVAAFEGTRFAHLVAEPA
jgi:LPS sulfotransferase NodH